MVSVYGMALLPQRAHHDGAEDLSQRSDIVSGTAIVTEEVFLINQLSAPCDKEGMNQLRSRSTRIGIC